jgi:hypothetical protein
MTFCSLFLRPRATQEPVGEGDVEQFGSFVTARQAAGIGSCGGGFVRLGVRRK